MAASTAPFTTLLMLVCNCNGGGIGGIGADVLPSFGAEDDGFNVNLLPSFPLFIFCNSTNSSLGNSDCNINPSKLAIGVVALLVLLFKSLPRCINAVIFA